MRCKICKCNIDYSDAFAATSYGPVCWWCINDLVKDKISESDNESNKETKDE